MARKRLGTPGVDEYAYYVNKLRQKFGLETGILPVLYLIPPMN